MQLVVGGDEEELSSRVEGQRGNGDVALREPALAAALQEQKLQEEGPEPLLDQLLQRKTLTCRSQIRTSPSRHPEATRPGMVG